MNAVIIIVILLIGFCCCVSSMAGGGYLFFRDSGEESTDRTTTDDVSGNGGNGGNGNGGNGGNGGGDDNQVVEGDIGAPCKSGDVCNSGAECKFGVCFEKCEERGSCKADTVPRKNDFYCDYDGCVIEEPKEEPKEEPPKSTPPPSSAPVPTCKDPVAYYLHFAPDVKKAGVDARGHWTKFGWKEGRKSCWPKPTTKPRPTSMGDCGYPSKTRGWYDMQGQGAKNDFCRFVGNWPGYFSCQLAGTTTNTPQGRYPDSKANDPHDKYTGGFSGHNCGAPVSAPTAPTCNKASCNTTMKDWIVNKYWRFDPGALNPCKGCPKRGFTAPYQGYKDGKWHNCGSKQGCYDYLKID